MPKEQTFISDTGLEREARPRTVSQGVNFKTGEGLRLGPWQSFEEWEAYAEALIAEDYDDEI